MIEKGYMTEQELAAKMEEIRARFSVPDEMESPIKKAPEAMIPSGQPSANRNVFQSSYTPRQGIASRSATVCA